ncbi:MAG TPA: hypothetical protein VE326_11405 [Candidatus Binatia bacterium]|nr:hypothetical protein [Candidatus Binatia bacterium]
MARDQGVYGLIFNGLTTALTKEQWMPLSERERVAAAIYDTLEGAGVEFHRGGLDRLWRVAAEHANKLRQN